LPSGCCSVSGSRAAPTTETKRVCARLPSITAPGLPVRPRWGCHVFRGGQAKGTQLLAQLLLLRSLQLSFGVFGKYGPTLVSQHQVKQKARWKKRAEPLNGGKRAGLCMAQTLERLGKPWKEIISYVAKKTELCFGGMRRNVRRV